MVKVEWVAGFVEGEGTFTFHMHYNHTTRNGVAVKYKLDSPTFQVAQKERQPLDLLKEFFDELEVHGKVFERFSGHGAFEYRVVGIANCIKVYDALRPHMNSDRKKAQADEWRTKIKELPRNRRKEYLE